MTKRQVNNPLALAALSCLFERPMHPYEMATRCANAARTRALSSTMARFTL